MKTDGIWGKCEPKSKYNSLLPLVQQEIIRDNVAAMFESEDSEFQGFVDGTLKLQALINEYKEMDTDEARQIAEVLKNCFESIARFRFLNCYFAYYKIGEQSKAQNIIYVFENVDKSVDYVKRITGKYLGTKEFYDFARLSNDAWKNIDNYHYNGHTLYFYD